MKTSEILDRAADVIVRNGWVQDDWYEFGRADDPRACPVCAGGGIDVAAGYDPGEADDSPSLNAAIEAFAAHIDPAFNPVLPGGLGGYGTVTSWNDTPGRTAEEVVRELRAAAASEREAGR